MNILVVTPHFYPEKFIINEISLALEEQGHTVFVLTGKPHYPQGKLFNGYKVFGIIRETYGSNIQVWRAPMLPRMKGRIHHLALNYLSFVIGTCWVVLFKLRKIKLDSVFVFAVSPITVVLPGILLKKLNSRIKLVTWVQDLWPHALRATGHIKNRTILWLIQFFVDWIYSQNDLLLAQSKGFLNLIKQRTKVGVEYYPNSFLLKNTFSTHSLLSLELTNLFLNYKCFIIAGNLGKAQDLMTVLDAADNIRSRSDIKIILIGEGSALYDIVLEIKNRKLNNVISIGRVSAEEMAEIYSKSWATLVTLVPDADISLTLPWRIQTYLAYKKCIIGAINGEGAAIIQEANCGFVGPASDSQVLSNHILMASELSKFEIDKFGLNGFQYYLDNFEMNDQIKVLERFLFS